MDSLRAIAVGAVFLSHSGNWWWNAKFEFGVPIFFAISAFLLYRPYVASRTVASPGVGTADFLRRRILRIVPAYWFALLGVIASTGFAVDAVAAAPRSMLFLQAYRPETIFQLVGGAWSLCVEAAFYLVLPLYAIAVRRWANGPHGLRRELWLMAAVAAASIAFRGVAYAIAGGYSVIAEATIPGTALWFAVGMSAAIISVGAEAGHLDGRFTRRLTTLRPAAWWALAAVLFAATYIPLSTARPLAFDPVNPPPWNIPDELADFVLYGLAAGCMLAPAVFATSERSAIRRLLASAPLAWLGLVSYGIFLWHELAIRVFRSDLGWEWRGIPPAAVATVGVAALSYYVVERPFARRKPGVATIERAS